MKKREKKDPAKCRNHFMKIRVTQGELFRQLALLCPAANEDTIQSCL